MRAYYVITLYILCVLLYACGTPSSFPISMPSNGAVNDGIVGNWKMEEDTNKHNFYEITQRDKVDKFNYHVRFFNRGGTNPTYEANIFFSKVADLDNGDEEVLFLNVPYWEEIGGQWKDRGYFFVRILGANDDFTGITTATVNSSELSDISSGMEMRRFISRNLNNPNIYSDTVHFYKVNKSTAELRQPRK